MNGKIIKINTGIYTILLENKVFCECVQRGKLLHKKQKPKVGDNVVVDTKDFTIENILERKNELERPLIANIDELFIIMSTKTPDFSTYLLDKFLVLSLKNKIEPVIIITKMDLLPIMERMKIRKYMNYYRNLGYKVFTNKQIFAIKNLIKNKVVCLTGQTGSGKSTMLNKINKNLLLKTGEVSIALGRGKHTTRIVQLHEINGGLIADTPGFSSLEIKMKKEELKHYFKEFNIDCKYKTCLHMNEKGCIIKDKLKNDIIKERYDNYKKLLSEVE